MRFNLRPAIGILVFSIFIITACRQQQHIQTEAESQYESNESADQADTQGGPLYEDAELTIEESEISKTIQGRSQGGSEPAAELTKTEVISLPQKEKDYTIMSYMIGSNLEGRYHCMAFLFS